MEGGPPTVAILGASGLIGQAVAVDLLRNGYPVVALARGFTRAQHASFGSAAIESALIALETQQMARLLAEQQADIVVNCLGVLQDSPRGRTDEVHRGFVSRLIEALGTQPKPALLIHLSIPGREEEDETLFSRTKRDGERLIASSSLPFLILRPGFVIAPAAYGGSALVRALAALPLRLPENVAGRPFAVTDIGDITRTIALVARRWQQGERHWHAKWDVMERYPSSVGGVVDAFRRRYGSPEPAVSLPGWLLAVGTRLGDVAAYLG
jgi:uncharacterized protein YbjT (DUF2867 family)